MVSWARIAAVTVLGLSTLQNVAGHMKLFAPIVRGEPRIKKQYFGIADYDLNAPLNSADYPGKFPCRYQKKGPAMAKYTAGKSFAVMFKTGNSHRGGHCQFAISYDNGETWVVLKTIIELCFMDLAPWVYNIPLPKGAKNGPALFGWGWMNAEGNREYYMNCADIEINGGSDTGSLTGPELFVGQLDGKPKIPEWAYTDGKKDGKEHFFNRKVVTIPAGAKATRDGTVVGEACNGHKPAKMPPAKIPWDRFRDDDQDHQDDSVKTVFVATSENPGIGVKGDSEAKYPYVDGENYVIPIDGDTSSSSNSTATTTTEDTTTATNDTTTATDDNTTATDDNTTATDDNTSATSKSSSSAASKSSSGSSEDVTSTSDDVSTSTDSENDTSNEDSKKSKKDKKDKKKKKNKKNKDENEDSNSEDDNNSNNDESE